MSQTLILDNGVGTMKVGFATDDSPRVIPNCITKSKNERKRVYTADEFSECKDHSSLYFLIPAEKGYIGRQADWQICLVNWDVEQKIWDRVMRKDVLDVNFSDTKLILTDPICIVPAIKDISDEIVFEQYGYHSLSKTSGIVLINAPSMIALADTVSEFRTEHCCVVVDSGYSFTHIVPYCNGVPIRKGIIRIDVGGKVLTNLLKEWISYRHLNVMEETCVINECKEDICYVADDFKNHMRMAQKFKRKKRNENSIIREYVLPDFTSHNRGFVREPQDSKDIEDCQKLILNLERFTVPEVLFSPSDIGILQMGIPEAIACAVNRCPKAMHGRLYNNIILVGGNSAFPGYMQRIERDLRKFASDLYVLRFRDVSDPILHAWRCGQQAFLSGAFEKRFVTRAEYEETGGEICRKKFLQFC
uniref:Actin-related protein 6 n=1 Tax=Syphacia muris TaxID=451379 RepID=A0A0N5AXB5_9BILA